MEKEKMEKQIENNTVIAKHDDLTNMQRMSRQLVKFFGKVQSAETRNDTSYRSLLNHFRLLDLDGRHSDYIFDAMQILYCDTPLEEDDVRYSEYEMQSFFATLKLYAIAYCSQNRQPNVSGVQDADTLAIACGKFARATQSQKWCNDRMSVFLESKSLTSNFRYLDNIVSRMGKSGYRFDYIKLFYDLTMMFSKNKKLGTDIRKRWAQQYARTVNRIESTTVENNNEGE